MLDKAAAVYHLPPMLLKAIAYAESEWDHYGADGKVKIRVEPDGRYGVGIMQVTVLPNDANYQRLHDDISFNIQEGARILAKKAAKAEQGNPKGALPGDRGLIENWWYATLMYNSWNHGAEAYVERVRQLVIAPLQKIDSFTSPFGWTSPQEAISGFELGNYFTALAGDTFFTFYGGSFVSYHGIVHPWRQADDPVSPPDQLQHTYSPAAGWYMVSAPRNNVAADLFGTTVWSWNPATRNVAVTTIEPGRGYWVKLPANKSISITGAPITTDVTLNVSPVGWHQISAPWSYPKAHIQVTRGAVTKSWAAAVAAGWVRGEIYGYKATDGAYTTTATMNSWYGYWMKALVNGASLKLAYASGMSVSAAAYAPLAAPMVFAPADLPGMPSAAATTPPLPLDLRFDNSPNPVTDVHTTYFEVKGAAVGMVEAVKVEIYDLTGTLIYDSGEVAGTSLAWHTDNDYGEYLANGVYLYKMYAKVQGKWVASKVKKLVILR
jgi:hypothetical protein